ncbi:OmpA family protein [Jatrophihabitans sp. GAS493]|uniref:OmpA family protein n=1 Tax=Jatrophihabitans sp. GAS493 TaxID=1907575 RepID=UPI000BB95996|nr:OmpA family protein [Jatrophihabitans sp. GAS493]SOD73506.1 OmpA family protein [Jatrophihabitans sp. GAS493]
MKHTTRVIAAITGVIVVLLALAACGGNPNKSTRSSTGTSPAPVNCPAAKLTIDPTTLTASTPTVAILGATGPGISYYQSDVTTVLNSSTNSKAHVLVNGVGDPGTAPDLAANTVLIGDGPNEAIRKHNLECKTAAVTRATSGTVAAAPTAPQPNVFGALNTLAGNLKGNPSKAPVDVVLLSPLSAAAGGVDLSNAATLKDPVVAINQLAAQGLIPDCTGWQFYAVGADRGMPDARAAQLKEFWRQFALKCGGQLVAWTAHLSQFPTDGAIQAADTSQLPVVKDPVKIVATLKDVTFDDGQADFRPEAAGQLDQLLALTQQTQGSILVDGYTDIQTTETTEWLNSLSTARAQAVADWLVAHGVDRARLHADGHGPTDLIYPSPATADEHQANRRVTVTLYRQADA